MNTMNLAERVFAIMRDLPPDGDGWTVCDTSGDGVQIFGSWNRCKRDPAQILACEFLKRIDRANDDRIEGDVECQLRREMVTASTSQRLWTVTVSIVLEDTTISELLVSASVMCREQLKAVGVGGDSHG